MSGGWLSIHVCLGALVLILPGCSSPPGGSGERPGGVGAEVDGAGFRPTPGAPFDPAPGPAPDPPAGPIGFDALPDTQPDVLARGNGEPIRKQDLAEFLCLADPLVFRVMLDNLTRLRILRNEVERLRIEIPETAVDARRKTVEKQDEKAARAAGQDLATYVGERYGFSLPVYRVLQRILARIVVARERAVRFSQILEDRVEGRIIVVEDREEAERIVGQLGAGADFGAVARRSSIHETRARGGLLPPIGRWGVHPEIEKRFFGLEPGEFSKPLLLEERGKKLFAILKCLRFFPARRVSYAEVRDEIEQELKSRPFQVMEDQGWLESMRKRYDIQTFIQAPNFEMVGGNSK